MQLGKRSEGGGVGGPLVLALCALAALLEGFDNQSMGVAAPSLVPEFGLDPAQDAWLKSAAPVGLFLGAAAGGRIADRHGRKWTLAASMFLLGACSLASAHAPSFGALLLARGLTGVGLGGAMPNFIALASEAAPATRRVGFVSLLMAGMPLGGMLSGLVALGEGPLGYGWRAIFQIGGVLPMALAAVIAWRMPAGAAPPARLGAARDATPSHAQAEARLQGVSAVLFGDGRARTTLLLWGGYFFTQLVLLLMLNWLPSLLVAQGYTRAQASLASMCFNFAGAACSLAMGQLHSGERRRTWVAITYAGMALALAAIPWAGHSFVLASLAVVAAGVFTIGAQLVLFALAPLYYPRAVRGTGTGWAVAIGRLGSVFGPLYAGALLSAGYVATGVLLGIVPFVLLGGSAAFGLAGRARDP